MKPNEAVEKIMRLAEQRDMPWLIDALYAVIQDRYKAGFLLACDQVANIDEDAAEIIYTTVRRINK